MRMSNSSLLLKMVFFKITLTLLSFLLSGGGCARSVSGNWISVFCSVEVRLRPIRLRLVAARQGVGLLYRGFHSGDSRLAV